MNPLVYDKNRGGYVRRIEGALWPQITNWEPIDCGVDPRANAVSFRARGEWGTSVAIALPAEAFGDVEAFRRRLLREGMFTFTGDAADLGAILASILGRARKATGKMRNEVRDGQPTQ